MGEKPLALPGQVYPAPYHKPWLQENTNFSSRKRTGYVLIGTFLSFGLAIIKGLIINWVLGL